MAYLSPGVYIQEIDSSAIAPTVSNSVAFFAGNFTKGPVEQPFVITNKDELEYFFGKPTNENYNEWFQCYKFFDYANQLVISRAFTELNRNTSNITVSGDYGIGMNLLSGFDNIKNIFKGSRISFENSQSYIYQVTNINYNNTDPQNPYYELEIVYVTADGELTDDGLQLPVMDGEMVYIFESHRNAGIDAYQFLDTNQGGYTPIPDYNQSYYLIKNSSDFELKESMIGFDTGVKLKFFAKTPGEVNSNIEIAICNSYDFEDYRDDNGNKDETRAQAFDGIPLDNFFEYRPEGDDIGIIIREGATVETYIVSFDENSVDGNNKSKYVETVINSESKLVYVIDNKSLDKFDYEFTYNDGTTTTYETYIQSHIYMNSQGDTISDAPLLVSGPLELYGGNSPKVTIGDIYDAYFTVEDKEVYEIDIVIGNENDGGASALNLANHRADCIAFVGASYEHTVGKKSAEATRVLVDYIKGRTNFPAPMRTMFGAFFGNYHRIYDNYNKRYRWVNVAGDMAGLRANTNTNQASWWASAGLKRGIVRNVDKIAFSPNQAQRDELYKNNINPIVNFPGEGILCWGQKTLLNYASSFDRINVRGLFNTLERAMAKASRSQVFEFNDAYTRNSILAMFNPYLSSVKAGRGISDYLVICDESNNTPDVISRNELRVDIYIKPMYSAEFIILTFNNVGTRSFASVIGS